MNQNVCYATIHGKILGYICYGNSIPYVPMMKTKILYEKNKYEVIDVVFDPYSVADNHLYTIVVRQTNET